MAGAESAGLSDVLVYLSLFAIAFPSPFLFRIGSHLIFPHYLVLMLAIPVLVAQRPLLILPLLPTLAALSISTVLNPYRTSLTVVASHGLHLIAIGILSSRSFKQALHFAKLAVVAYVVAILLAESAVLGGRGDLVSGLLVATSDFPGQPRIAAFATEPAFAGMILLILCRFILMHDPAWLSSGRLVLVLLAMLMTLSLFSILAAFLLLVMCLHRMRRTRALIGMLVGAAILALASWSSDYFAQRIAGLDPSLGLMGLGSGTIRLLPFMYLFEAIHRNFWMVLWGEGADSFGNAFFLEIGQFNTAGDQLSGHMAAVIYDYGLLAVIPFFFWSRPKRLFEQVLYLLMTLLILINTGIGTYLFLIFGVYALVEQGSRSRAQGSHSARFQPRQRTRLPDPRQHTDGRIGATGATPLCGFGAGGSVAAKAGLSGAARYDPQPQAGACRALLQD
jgi:hypothetical protein